MPRKYTIDPQVARSRAAKGAAAVNGAAGLTRRLEARVDCEFTPEVLDRLARLLARVGGASE